MPPNSPVKGLLIPTYTYVWVISLLPVRNTAYPQSFGIVFKEIVIQRMNSHIMCRSRVLRVDRP